MSTSPTQQFDGTTIEEALGAAVASMGDDLEIIDAQRVRKRRRFGVRREERFEVIAAPRSSSEEFDDVLRRMVDRVDDRERAHEVDLRGARADATVDLRTPARAAAGTGVDLADSDLSWWEGAEFVVPATPEPAAAVDRPEMEIDVRTPPTALDQELFGSEPVVSVSEPPPGVFPAPERPGGPVSAPDVVPAADPVPVAAPVLSAPEPARTAPVNADTRAGAGWSLDGLADLGIAPLILERVADRHPVGDLEWVGALAAAIEEVAATIDTHGANVELTGHGRHAAVDLIAGLCRGMRVGHLVIDDVRVEATPVELALAVRACLQG